MTQDILVFLVGALLGWEAWDRLIKPRLAKIAPPVIAEARKAERYAASVFYRLEPTLQKELHMITHDEEAILASIKGLLTGKAAAETTAASETARADAAEAKAADLQSQLDAEKANHVDLVNQLQGVLTPPSGP